MSTTPVVQPHHLRRKAVIDIRQSTGHQVLTNTESQQLQRAMREQAHHLGWPEERIEVVETDLGRSAHSTQRRDGSKTLLADVALGQGGIVLSYASTRLSRHCTDWYPLLDLCAYNHCLIADRDGAYDAATPNGRLLLGASVAAPPHMRKEQGQPPGALCYPVLDTVGRRDRPRIGAVCPFVRLVSGVSEHIIGDRPRPDPVWETARFSVPPASHGCPSSVSCDWRLP